MTRLMGTRSILKHEDIPDAVRLLSVHRIYLEETRMVPEAAAVSADLPRTPPSLPGTPGPCAVDMPLVT